MKSINQFTDEIAEQRLQQKMQDTGRGQEFGGKNAESFEVKEKRDMTSFPKKFDRLCIIMPCLKSFSTGC